MYVNEAVANKVLVVSELGPVLVFTLAFMLLMGGVMVFATAVCGWNNVADVSIDFWKGLVHLKCS